MRHRWGKWWDLAITGSQEYERTDGWLTKENRKIKADLDLALFDNLLINPTYELERKTDYTEREPLDFGQERDEEAKLKLEYRRDFTSLIMTAFTYEFGMKWEESLDEVLNREEVVEYSEDTKFKLGLVDFIKDMRLEGEITRKGPEKSLTEPLKKSGGRNHHGRITSRRRGGGNKRKYRRSRNCQIICE